MTGSTEPKSNRRANRRRGEVEAVIDGQRRILMLTLGGLAELETAFGASDLMILAARFEQGRVSSADAMVILAAGLRGGGLDVSPDEVGRMQPEGGTGGWIAILADLLSATFAEPGDTQNRARNVGNEEAGGMPRANPLPSPASKPQDPPSRGTR